MVSQELSRSNKTEELLEFDTREETAVYVSYSRFRYIRAKVKSTLKRTVNPRSAAAPIQYQFSSGKISKFLSTAMPNLVKLSEA